MLAAISQNLILVHLDPLNRLISVISENVTEKEELSTIYK